MSYGMSALGISSLAVASVALSARAWQLCARTDAGDADPRQTSPWRTALRPLAKHMSPDGTHREQMIARLQSAGRSNDVELGFFLEEKIGALLAGVIVGALLAVLIGANLGLLLFCVGCVGGIVGPGMALDVKATERRELIGGALPDAVDLLMTCVDAGLSIEQSLARVAKETKRSAPVLAEEFSLTSSEAESGIALADALRRMSRRVQLDEMSGLCSMIAQANELGAPIVATLAEYADSARKIRMSKLEEWAGKLVVKLIFPTAVFLLPAVLVVMLGPALLSVMSAMKGF